MLPVYDMEDYAYGPPQLGKYFNFCYSRYHINFTICLILYAIYILSADRPKLLITVPALGTGRVYYSNGVEITQNNMNTSFITYDTTTRSYNVRIRPPLDRYSPR